MMATTTTPAPVNSSIGLPCGLRIPDDANDSASPMPTGKATASPAIEIAATSNIFARFRLAMSSTAPAIPISNVPMSVTGRRMHAIARTAAPHYPTSSGAPGTGSTRRAIGGWRRTIADWRRMIAGWQHAIASRPALTG